MAIYSFIGYDPSVINIGGGTASLDNSYDLSTDRVNIEVNDTATGNTIGSGGNYHIDNGVIFDGDRFSNENGDDNSQFGTVTEMDGTAITSGQIYLEQSYTLTAAGETTITLYRVEIAGTVVGYVATSPLVEGVTYATTTSNVTPGNAPDTSQPGGIIDVPCFVAGTMIETPQGLVAVETLKAGDLVVTAEGVARPIRWAGSKLIAPKLCKDRNLSPIRIPKDAFGPDLPRRDLLVSPNHRVVLNGAEVQLLTGEEQVFVAAKFLVGFAGITRADSLNLVPYVHLLLDEHAVLISEGVATESLHPGDMALRALAPDAVEEVLYLFPDLKDQPFSGYGPLALRALKNWEANVVIAALSGAGHATQIAA